jgi:HD superfamily phosphodiesterase
MALLIFDQFSYIYHGDPSELGYYMVRISNGLVFFLQLFIPHLVTQYVKDLFLNESSFSKAPHSLKACDGLFVVGTVLLVVSQFTGLYYTFDESNTYFRAPAFALCYAFPLAIVILQEVTIWLRREHLRRGLVISLMLNIAWPTLMSVVQFFYYGVSLTNMSMAFVVIVFYVYTLEDLSRDVETARQNELASYKEAERREAVMFEETAEALANAIDAKDKYTHGHSARVAVLSRQIAQEAGYSEKDSRLVYFSALLHDVGKIGVRDEIINKTGKLTDEEFAQIKVHPVLGNQILSSIKQEPTLSIGAHYHHERYDGSGYPEGLAGEAIPEIARIIAVADAYDAMSSSRSYRDKLPEAQMERELTEGMGKQFDPRFAQIMLGILRSGSACAAPAAR